MSGMPKETEILSELARKGGTTLACNPDAERLMRRGGSVVHSTKRACAGRLTTTCPVAR